MWDSAQPYGLFLNVENPRRRHARDALTQTVRNAPAARTFGYHEVWLAEHNYRSYANSNALALLFAPTSRLVSVAISGRGDIVGARESRARMHEVFALIRHGVFQLIRTGHSSIKT
ncbi:hypothetical protein [Paraburkholderia dilworthii]|uniref:hypothetical protein n=1 Tax=Paraburkholderia dilworthii TaxID=948106 RepID=UPI00041CDF00|nr:hypothetical protein [Paraburkholderia dilworthii]